MCDGPLLEVHIADVDVTADNADARFNLATVAIDGPVTVGGQQRPACPADDELTLTMRGLNATPQSRQDLRCVGTATELTGRLPVNAAFEVAIVGNPVRNAQWRSTMSISDINNGALDLSGFSAHLSGPIHLDGSPLPCATPMSSLTFSGENGDAATVAVCVDGVQSIAPMSVPRGLVTLTSSTPSTIDTIDIDGDRLDEPLLLRTPPRGTLEGAITFTGPIACPDDGLNINIVGASLRSFDCAAGRYSFLLRPGRYDLRSNFFAAAIRDIDLATDVEVIADTIVQRDLVVDSIGDGDLRLLLRAEGLDVEGRDIVVNASLDGSVGEDAVVDGTRNGTDIVISLPRNTVHPVSSVDAFVDVDGATLRYSEGQLVRPRSGQVVWNIDTGVVGGTVVITGPTPVSCSEQLGILSVGNNRLPVGCDGRFGPAPIQVGAHPVRFAVTGALTSPPPSFVLQVR